MSMRPNQETWTARGAVSIYRRPFRQRRRWRCRKRNLKTGEVMFITLDVPRSATLKAAKDAVEALARAERAALDIAAEGLGAALDQFVATRERPRPVTRSGYQLQAGQLKAALGAETLVRDIAVADIDVLFSGPFASRTIFKKGKPTVRTLSGRSKLKHFAFAKRFWKWAVKRKLAAENVVEIAIDEENLKGWQEQARIRKEEIASPLTRAEARKLLAACEGKHIIPYERTHYGHEEKIEAKVEAPDYLRLFIHLGLMTGLRKSNLIGSEFKPGLKWADIDLERAVVRIDRERMKSRIPLELPLHPEVVQILRSRLRTLDRVGEQIIPAGYQAGLRRAFVAALKRAGLAGRRVHDLRTSFATWIGAFAPSFVMSQLLGHAKSTVTSRYGQNLSIEDLRAWLDKLPPLLSSAPAAVREA